MLIYFSALNDSSVVLSRLPACDAPPPTSSTLAPRTTFRTLAPIAPNTPPTPSPTPPMTPEGLSPTLVYI